MRKGAGPPASLIRSSISSTMVRTWCGLPPLVITNASVITRMGPTARITGSSPFLADAAPAATLHQWRMSSIVGLRVTGSSGGSSSSSKSGNGVVAVCGGVGSGPAALVRLLPQDEDGNRQRDDEHQDDRDLLAGEAPPLLPPPLALAGAPVGQRDHLGRHRGSRRHLLVAYRPLDLRQCTAASGTR